MQCITIIGQLTLSPMTVAPVCRVGDTLQLTCTASGIASESIQSIRWHISQVNEQGMLKEVTNSVLIDRSDDNQMKRRVVNSTTFTFMRTSAKDTLSLISTLSTDSVSIGLNGTVVRCTDVANPMTSASTTIQVIDISEYIKC